MVSHSDETSVVQFQLFRWTGAAFEFNWYSVAKYGQSATQIKARSCVAICLLCNGMPMYVSEH